MSPSPLDVKRFGAGCRQRPHSLYSAAAVADSALPATESPRLRGGPDRSAVHASGSPARTLEGRAEPCPNQSPWDLLRATIRGDRAMAELPCFALESPDRGEIAGIGSAIDVAAVGADRVETIQASLRSILGSALSEPRDSGCALRPVAIGGFSFDPSGDARFTVPSRMWSRLGDDATRASTWCAGSEPDPRPTADEPEFAEWSRASWTEAVR